MSGVAGTELLMPKKALNVWHCSSTKCFNVRCRHFWARQIKQKVVFILPLSLTSSIFRCHVCWKYSTKDHAEASGCNTYGQRHTGTYICRCQKQALINCLASYWYIELLMPKKALNLRFRTGTDMLMPKRALPFRFRTGTEICWYRKRHLIFGVVLVQRYADAEEIKHYNIRRRTGKELGWCRN